VIVQYANKSDNLREERKLL